MPAAMIATFLTPPEPHPHLRAFIERVRPPGWWGPVGGAEAESARRAVGPSALAWVTGNVGVFGLTFGVGGLLLGRPARGVLFLLVGGAALLLTLRLTRRVRGILDAPTRAARRPREERVGA